MPRLLLSKKKTNTEEPVKICVGCEKLKCDLEKEKKKVEQLEKAKPEKKVLSQEEKEELKKKAQEKKEKKEEEQKAVDNLKEENKKLKQELLNRFGVNL